MSKRNRRLLRMGWILVAVMLCVSLVALTAGCAAPPSQQQEEEEEEEEEEEGPQYGGTLRPIWEPIPPTIGWPLDMIAGPGGSAVQGILETLLRADEEGNAYGWLAESYEVAEDLMSITFNLREGVKFHDGSDFNAEVVKWNLDAWIDAGAQPSWESVDIINEYTVRVNLTGWKNSAPLSFCEALGTVFMVSKQAFDTNGLEWMQVNPVGTGPFIFESFVPDVHLKMVKNPDYWVEGRPYLDAIEITFSADPVTSKMSLLAGDVDIAATSLIDVAEYESLGFNVFTAAEAIWPLIPDTKNPGSPWANQKVREAVEYAIDREAIAESLGYGYLEAPYQVAPRTSTAYDPNFSWEREYDPDTARQLLTEAGYPDGFDTTIYIFPPAGDNDDYILAAQAYLSEVGINADLEYTQWGLWATFMGPGSWPENGCLYAPIPRFDKAFLGGMGFIFGRLGQSWERTPELAQAFGAATSSLEIDIETIRAFVDLIGRDAMLIPVHEGSWNRVTAPYVHAEFDTRGYILYWDLEDAWLEQ